jgi:hypothetical protein|tara:strand:- start:220 stop:396 length:177 start_codon:yes stop_codon:yes gene_type:complete
MEEYSVNFDDTGVLDKLFMEDDPYQDELDYSGPEYNDIGDLDDEDFDEFVVQQLGTLY